MEWDRHVLIVYSEILYKYIPSMGHTCTKIFFIYYVKFTFNWVSCILSGSSMLGRPIK